MPLTKYKLHKKSLQDSINLNLSSSIMIEPPPPPPPSSSLPSNIPENNNKRQRIESMEQSIPLESTITITAPIGNIDKQPHKKKAKAKSSEDLNVQPPVIPSTLETPVVKPNFEESIENSTFKKLKEPLNETEMNTEPPVSIPSTNGRIRELKSKTPTWKAQQPIAKGNLQGKNYYSY